MELEKAKVLVAKLAKEHKIDVQNAWDILFFDEIILWLSRSNYKNIFVFKGGFYLQSVVGIETRSTMDIDFKLIGNNLDNEKLYEVFNEVCLDKMDSNILFNILSIDDITAETKYGGKTIKLEAKFYNIKKRFGIDIGFGDVVTPNPIEYSYPLSYRKDECKILAYPIETIIAEKFETLISKGTMNSRSKDLYDLYLLNKTSYDVDLLNAAMVNTFNLRNTIYDYKAINDTLFEIFDFYRVEELYNNYSKKNKFANNVSFEMCKTAVYSIFDKLAFTEKINLSDFQIELHLVRHGQDEQNKLGGWSDNHLTDIGKAEIIKLYDQLDVYDIFISSDLQRVKETSLIINDKLRMSIEFNPEFREVNNGDLKNLTIEEFKSNYPGLYFSSLKMDEKYPNGESPQEFYTRIQLAFKSLIDKNRSKKILLVTHGGVIAVILCLINGYKYSNKLKITPKTGTIIKLK